MDLPVQRSLGPGNPVLESVLPVIAASRDVTTDVARVHDVAQWLAYEELPFPRFLLPFALELDRDDTIDFILVANLMNFAYTDFETGVRFDQIASIMGCLQTNLQCQASCEALAGKGLGSSGQIWDEAVCTAGAGGASGSGGAGAATGAAGAGEGGAAASSAGGGHDSSGGGCALAPGAVSPSPAQTILVAAFIVMALWRQRRNNENREPPQAARLASRLGRRRFSLRQMTVTLLREESS